MKVQVTTANGSVIEVDEGYAITINGGSAGSLEDSIANFPQFAADLWVAAHLEMRCKQEECAAHQGELAALSAAHTALQNERDAIQNERDTLQSDKNSLTESNALLQRENAELKTKLDAAMIVT